MDAGLREALAHVPEAQGWRFRLPPEWEERFARETGAARSRQIRVWILFSLAVNWASAPLDVASIPDVWWLGWLLRLYIVTPVSLAAWWLLATTRPRWQETVASVAPLSIALLAVLVLFASSAEFNFVRSGTTLSVGIIWVNALVPLRLRETMLFAAITLVIGDAIIAVGVATHPSSVETPDVVGFQHIIVALPVVARFMTERESRRSFLLGLRLQIRAEELARSNAKLLEMSNTDPLTGLANRRSFDQAFAQAWEAASPRSPLALMMIDIDHFKQFNDTAGHVEGDRCLSMIARGIADQVRRDRDIAARLGGEEFAVLMPGTPLDGAQALAERVRTAIGALLLPHPGRSGRAFVSVSIGVAATEPRAEGATPPALVKAADEALYEAKAAGRDRVVASAPLVQGAGEVA